jgi:hypothetical protein
MFRAFEGVIPVLEPMQALDSQAAANRGFVGLFDWMQQAEMAWALNRTSKLTFLEQANYFGKLTSQFPIAPLRIVYAKAGTLPAACLVRDTRTVIDHKLYWMSTDNENEARYLMSILNSEAARTRIEGQQSRGQWGARDFDKVVFNLAIPRFDSTVPLHQDLASAGQDAEDLAAQLELLEGVGFQRARKLVRDALTEAGLAQKIDALVNRLLPAGQ